MEDILIGSLYDLVINGRTEEEADIEFMRIATEWSVKGYTIASGKVSEGKVDELWALKNKPMVKDKLKATVRDVANFPKEGILFKDITPVLADAQLCSELVEELALGIARSGKQVQAIAGIESRGFFFGFMLANRLGIPFIPIRKAGKLPFTTVSIEYALEYGTAKIEMNSDAVTEGMHVLVHDDLLATGGTAAAAAELITRQGGVVAGFNFVINLAFLNGSENLVKYSDNISAILEY
jgi:adenine phosphoribosyltransferase